MKFKQIVALMFVTSVLCITGVAQAGSVSKVGVVDSSAFSDPKTGIKRLINASKSLDTQFKPLRDEVTALQVRYDALVKEITSTGSVADPASLNRKRDQADQLQKDIKRKQEDGQALLNRRAAELTEPIYRDLGVAFTAFGRARGFDLIIDMSKVPVFLINQSIDITEAFIAEYNAKNP
jgi:Skp family chaperone for outer membrane proteins